MSGNIRKEDIEHLAELARISLSETEKKKFLKDAELILEYFEELKQAEADDASLSVDLRSGATDMTNIVDEDEINRELSQKGIESFPETEKDCLKAPEIIRNPNE